MRITAEIIGTPIKVYRKTRCFCCDKCYEFDIENIVDETKEIDLICPWCNARKKLSGSYLPEPGDRSVRCD